MKNFNNPFAEIIESSLTSWLAQSWHWDESPVFGSLVTIESKNRILFGMVYDIKTGSMDPVRYPFAYQKTEEQLLKEQPQIFEFLKTHFSCLIIGYQENDEGIVYQLAPEPPKIHAFVARASESLCKIFFDTNYYLPLIFGLAQGLCNVDELLLAALKELKKHQLLSDKLIEGFIETFSLLIGNDYRRLKLFLQRVECIMEERRRKNEL